MHFPWWLLRLVWRLARAHPLPALFPVVFLLLLLRLPVAPAWLPLIGLVWMAAGLAAWGVALGYRLHWWHLAQRLLISVVITGLVLALVSWAIPGGAGIPQHDFSARLLLLSFPLTSFFPLTYALFPGVARAERWDRQLADFFRFLLQGSLQKASGDHDGTLRVEWTAWIVGPSSLLILGWLLRHTVLVYPWFFAQLTLLALLYPLAWSFWRVIYEPRSLLSVEEDRS